MGTGGVLDLRATRSPISTARKFMRRHLEGAYAGPAIEEAVWTANELVTSAVGHQMTDICLVIDLTDEAIRVELRDHEGRLVAIGDERLVAEIRIS